ncbi:hypothetical protein GCM10009715_35670 [Paeniglutamicibacter psychrophenolicus]
MAKVWDGVSAATFTAARCTGAVTAAGPGVARGGPIGERPTASASAKAPVTAARAAERGVEVECPRMANASILRKLTQF